MTSNLETGPAQPAAQWRDRKRYMWLYGMIPPTAIFIATALVYAMNQLGWQQFSPIFFWIGPLLVYVILPLLDLNFGADGENAPDEVMEALENDKYYRYCTYIFIPFQYASFFLGAYYFTATDLSWIGFDDGISWISKLGIAASIGVLGGWVSIPRTRWATRRKSWSAGFRRSRWHRRSMVTFTSSTTAATTCASPLRKTLPARDSVRPSGAFGRAVCGAP